MRRLRWLPVFFVLFGCGADQSASRLAASREARYLLQTPEKIPESFWKEMQNPALAQDFLLQRQAGWSFWSEMLRPLPESSSSDFMVWQTWYSREDLQRIFRHLYEKLGVQGRHDRRAFTPDAIRDALQWNDHRQFQEAGWDAQRFEQWFAGFDSDEKKRSIPGMQKILFNQVVMEFMLQNYQRLEICQKHRQRQESCEALAWPEQAVFLKTSWRRSEQGFQVESFATHASALAQQWEKKGWTADGSLEPSADESYALRLPSGQKFHLTGLHASLRLKQDWYWTSLWLGQGTGHDWSSDQPQNWMQPWTSYRLCSVDGWQEPLAEPSIAANWPPELADLARLLRERKLHNWCSNPYLEPGPNNHKTNCVGCHQYAGFNWTQEDFRRRLNDAFMSMIQRSVETGPADFVWSLYAGPEPLLQPLMDDIEFFDVYDPYQ
jgi:hypothetical protein